MNLRNKKSIGKNAKFKLEFYHFEKFIIFIINSLCNITIFSSEFSILEIGFEIMLVVYKKRATSAFFHIFPSPSLHFPKSCHKLYYSKEKVSWGIPKTLLMDT